MTFLKMDALTWDTETRLGNAIGNIHIRSHYFDIQSDHALFDIANNRIQLDNNIKANVNIAL